MIEKITRTTDVTAGQLANLTGDPLPARPDDCVTIEEIWVPALPGEKSQAFHYPSGTPLRFAGRRIVS